MSNYQRVLVKPLKSFFLLGPRVTGKSTWLRTILPSAYEINLLKSSQYLPLSQNPSLLHKWIEELKPNSWVIIDEIQKIPSLLDEVHAAYEDKKLHFALSGSSARKLKRAGANLLAGRALHKKMFPLVKKEYQNALTLNEALDWGTLPPHVVDKTNRVESLYSYVENYLRQELIEEGLIRNLEPFARFLRIAGLYNGQTLNVENIARESHVKRPTVDKYLDVVEDTLIGFRLPALPAKFNRKEVVHPKFYMFDSGVARACAGLLSEEVDGIWRGFSFETYLLHEIRAYNSYSGQNRMLFYYRFAEGYEIDLVVQTKSKSLNSGAQYVGFEFKYAKRWDRRWSDPMMDFLEKSKGKVRTMIGVYTGSEIIEKKDLKIWPVEYFLMQLSEGKIF